MANPITATTTAPASVSCFAYFRPIPASNVPTPSIIGTVPTAKKNMDSAPTSTFPVASATIHMACKGPHGIRLFTIPTKNGARFPFANKRYIPLGNGIRSLRSAGNKPIRFPALTIMQIPTTALNTPCHSVFWFTVCPITEDNPPSTAPTNVYPKIRPRLYARLVRTAACFLCVSSAVPIHCESCIPPHIAMQ